MGKTYRKNPLDAKYGCFEHYRRQHRRFSRIWLWSEAGVEERYAADRAWDYEHWSKRRRDGRSSHYSRHAGGRKKKFSHRTAKHIRNETRKEIHRGMRKGDWDGLTYPTNLDGKKFIR